ncbi:NAD(P)H-hydrate dehydratase, partial [Pseudomonas syringae group genomosp. 7]|uniref:NAD(P)H-hydrate dehydratase n=1 Tax=Pseudomonas syringae group genomosp. 7 TaxID=251699 RepID=UPI00376F532D
AIGVGALILPSVAPRPHTADIGIFGGVLVIGGDHGFGCAALLSAECALRSGAGMVTLATRADHMPASLTRMPEIMSAGIRS